MLSSSFGTLEVAVVCGRVFRVVASVGHGSAPPSTLHASPRMAPVVWGEWHAMGFSKRAYEGQCRLVDVSSASSAHRTAGSSTLLLFVVFKVASDRVYRTGGSGWQPKVAKGNNGKAARENALG